MTSSAFIGPAMAGLSDAGVAMSGKTGKTGKFTASSLEEKSNFGGDDFFLKITPVLRPPAVKTFPAFPSFPFHHQPTPPSLSSAKHRQPSLPLLIPHTTPTAFRSPTSANSTAASRQAAPLPRRKHAVRMRAQQRLEIGSLSIAQSSRWGPSPTRRGVGSRDSVRYG